MDWCGRPFCIRIAGLCDMRGARCWTWRSRMRRCMKFRRRRKRLIWMWRGGGRGASGGAASFVLNRDLAKARQLEVNWESKAPTKLSTSLVLTGADLKAVNDFGAPNRVLPKEADKPVITVGRTMIEVPPRSYSVFQWQS